MRSGSLCAVFRSQTPSLDESGLSVRESRCLSLLLLGFRPDTERDTEPMTPLIVDHIGAMMADGGPLLGVLGG